VSGAAMSGSGLLLSLVIALGAALVGATIALRLKQPLILGYLLAGVAIGPFTPGFIGPTQSIAEIAELGVVFLMFVIGVQVSLRDVLEAGRRMIAGALLQVAIMIAIGWAVGRTLGWGHAESYTFGAVISNSSSAVLSKVYSDRGEQESGHAQLAIAWSSVQDISTVALVAGLALFGGGAGDALAVLGNAALFFFVLVPLAFFVLPWALRRATALGSRELFALVTVAVALSMAAGASLLGVSLALGAFLAGVVVGESDLAHRILGDAIPLRDVFSGIFFVSIGMLADPAFLAGAWPLVLLTVALIVIVKGAVTTAVAGLLGFPPRVAILIGAGLGQSAEFSFLMARIGLEEGVLRDSVFILLISAAILSIVLSPLATAIAMRLHRRAPAGRDDPRWLARHAIPPSGHAIVCGYGRVGSTVCALLARADQPFVVVEEDPRIVERLRAQGIRVVSGDSGQTVVLDRASIEEARLLVLCIPERMAVRRAVEHARQRNPGIEVLARTHSDRDRDFLEAHGVADAVVGETELALELGRRALARFGIAGAEAESAVADQRAIAKGGAA
jgi:CPA2 family monovalent cation:H+ antiporter-2